MIVFLIPFVVPIILLVIGLIDLEHNKERAKKFFIATLIFLLIGLGMCGTILIGGL